MKKNGFTLVELLITISILGIISGISIPLLRTLQANQVEKKYSMYVDNVEYAAKLYTDSYSEDLFGYSRNGCRYLKYSDMKKYKMLKDIDIDGISCNTDYTIVKVVKYHEKYYYSPYIGCGNKKGNGVVAEIFKPTKLETLDVCSGSNTDFISIVADPDKSDSKTSKTVSPTISLVSETGVLKSPLSIEYGYSLNNDSNISGEWKPLSFKIYNKSLQEKMIRGSKTQVFKSLTDVTSPKITGDIYLVIRVNELRNLDGESWRAEGDNHVIIGPYRVDNMPPTIKKATVTSSKTTHNDKKPQLNLEAIDEKYSAVSELRMCYAYDKKTCPIPKDGEELKTLTQYKKYTNKSVLNNISSDYDGSSHDIKVYIADAAGNVSHKTLNYIVSNSYKLTFDPDGGSTCKIKSIRQIENQPWKTKVVTDSGFENREFCSTTRTGYEFGGWYTNKNGKGVQVKNTDKAIQDLKVYAYWKPKTVSVTFNCNGGQTTGKQTFTYGKTGQKFSRTCTRAGYTLQGWKWKASGTAKDYDVSNGVADSWINKYGPTTTLYAHWKTITYKITYDLKGGKVSQPNKTSYTVETATFTLNNPTRDGYIFEGWTGTELSKATNSVKIPKESTGNRSYTANWKLASYTITLNNNGATTTGTNSVKVSKGNTSLPKITLPKKIVTITYTNKTGAAQSGGDFSKNYSLNGWYTAASGGSKVANNAATPVLQKSVSGYTDSKGAWSRTSGATLYAQWGNVTAKLPTLTKLGYTCEWTTNNGADSTASGGSWTFTSANARTFTAKCTPKKVTVTFDCNGGKITGTSNATATSTYTVGVTGNKFNKSCTHSDSRYKQDGWKFANDSGKRYETANGITDTWINSYSPKVTLKAHWVPKDKPTCSLKISNNPANANGWYRENTQITMTTTGVVDAKGLATSQNSTNGTTSVTVTREGTTTYYGFVKNATGTSSCSKTVKIDKTIPRCGVASGASTTWTKNNRTITLPCTDAHSGCVKTSYVNNYSTTTKTANITIQDKAGHSKVCQINVYVDKTIPSCGVASGQSTVWTKNNRTITLPCTDAHSGCVKTSYVNNYSATTKTANITIQDKVGNSRTCPVNVYVDKTAPTCGIASGQSTVWTRNNRTVRQPCNDSHSGCATATYGKSYSTTTRTDNITIQDRVGNSRTCPVNVYVDKTAPSCGSTSGQSTSWTRGNRTIIQHCNDSHSGCATATYGKSYSTTTRTAHITIQDKVGNTNSCPVNVYVDKTPPRCVSASGSSTEWTKNSRTITQYCTDNESGCIRSSYTNSYTTTTRTDHITIQDKARNTSSCPVNVYVDRTYPTISSIGKSNDNFSLSATIGDAHSGLKTYKWESESAISADGASKSVNKNVATISGNYTLTVTDQANNSYTYTFTNVYKYCSKTDTKPEHPLYHWYGLTKKCDRTDPYRKYDFRQYQCTCVMDKKVPGHLCSHSERHTTADDHGSNYSYIYYKRGANGKDACKGNIKPNSYVEQVCASDRWFGNSSSWEYHGYKFYGGDINTSEGYTNFKDNGWTFYKTIVYSSGSSASSVCAASCKEKY